MPRRSAAELSVVRVNGGGTRLRPPPELDDEEREVWLQLVGACKTDHFLSSDVPLLARYCEAVVLARRAAGALRSEGAVVAGRPNPWIHIQEKQIRALTALSMRLRVSPQARLRRETTGPRGPAPSTYDLMGDDDA